MAETRQAVLPARSLGLSHSSSSAFIDGLRCPLTPVVGKVSKPISTRRAVSPQSKNPFSSKPNLFSFLCLKRRGNDPCPRTNVVVNPALEPVWSPMNAGSGHHGPSMPRSLYTSFRFEHA